MLVLYATGRRPTPKGWGWRRLGVEIGRKGQIVVDGYSQTAVPSIFAVGDVTDRINLTPGRDPRGARLCRYRVPGQPTRLDHEPGRLGRVHPAGTGQRSA